jgi:hypothetical protein
MIGKILLILGFLVAAYIADRIIDNYINDGPDDRVYKKKK